MHSSAIPVAMFGALISSIATILLFLYYTGMRRGHAAGVWFVTFVIAIGVAVYRFSNYRRAFGGTEDEFAKTCFFLGLLIIVGTAFGIRLYRKWLDQQLTEEERAGGIRGLRAWLSPANLVVATLVSISAWQGLGWSVVLMLAFTIGLLLLWPALNMEKAPIAPPVPAAATASTSVEREKVLALLEAGKITAEESAELLHALSSSATTPSPARPVSARPRGIALAGAVLVLIGFFLPWFRFSPGEKLSAAMNDIGMAGMGLERMTHEIMPNATVTVRGGDVNNGLGWLVLVLGVSSALLPLLAPQMEHSVQRTARMIAIGAGGVVALYIASQDLSSVSIGIVLVLAGYACQGLGLWQDERPAHSTSQIPATDL